MLATTTPGGLAALFAGNLTTHIHSIDTWFPSLLGGFLVFGHLCLLTST